MSKILAIIGAFMTGGIVIAAANTVQEAPADLASVNRPTGTTVLFYFHTQLLI